MNSRLRLSCKSRYLVDELVPGLIVFEHGIEDEHEFAHASGEGQFFGFASGQEALVKGADHRVPASGHYRRHIEHAAQVTAASPDHAFASEAAALPVIRS